MSDLSRFFKHSSIYTIGNIINRLGAFLLLPVYTNYLTVSEYGALELFYVAMAIVSGVLGIGMAHATLRFYFDYEKQKDRDVAVSTNFIGSFVITLLGLLVISVFTEGIAREFLGTDQYTLGLYIIYATLLLELSSQICLAYIRAIENSVFFVVISFIKLVVQVALNSYLLIVEEAGVTGVLLGNLVTVLLGWIVLAYFTINRCGFKFHLNKFYPVMKYCAPFLLSTIVGLISTNADKFILNYLISLEALGLFALALKFSMIIDQLIGDPFSRSYGAFRYTVMNNSNAAELQASIVKYLLIAATFIALVISFFVKDVLNVMSNETFWPAADLVPIIMVSAVIKLLIYPAQTGILVAKKTKYLFYFRVISALVSAAGSYFLISYIGIEGACISLVFTEGVTLYLTHTYSQKYFEVTYEYWCLFKIILIALLVYIPVLFIGDTSALTLVIVKLILLALNLALVFRTGVLTNIEIVKIKVFLRDKLKLRSY